MVVSKCLCTIVAPDAAPELYTVLYTIVVCGVGFFFRGFRPSTSAIMSLTAFAEKSLSLKSDIRFRASCTEADDGVDIDVIRALSVSCHMVQAKSTSRATDPHSALFQCRLSSTRFCLRPAARIPTIVCKSSRAIQICGISTFRPGFVDFSGHQSPFATNSNVFQWNATWTEVKMAGTRFHEEKQQNLTLSKP